MDGLEKFYRENNYNTDIYFCFLTLQKSSCSDEEFDNFNHDKKLHLHWKGKGPSSIQNKLSVILEKEREGKIEPISEDSCFLLKSFISFIKSDFKSYVEEKNEKQERTKYGNKTIIEYIRDVAKALEDNENYKLSEIRKKVADKIKEESGLDINRSTLYCQMCVAIVNEANRRHFNVTKANCKEKNLFYYPNEQNKTIIRKYNAEIGNKENINIYTVDDNYKKDN